MTAPRRPGDPEPQQTDAERARALLLPVSEPQGQQDLDGDGVPAVLPGRPEPAQPPTRPAAAAEESGLTCWNCSFGNRTDRTFCRNCGAELRNPPARAAAPAPKRDRRKLLFLIGGIVAGLALLAGAVLGVTALVRALGDDDATVPADLIAAPPQAAAATAEDPQHPVRNVFDGQGDSWWGPGKAGDGKGEAVQADYQQPVHLRAIRIFPGTSLDPAEREQQARPRKVRIIVTDGQGKQSSERYDLKDGKPLLAKVDVAGARQVQIVMESAYGAAASKQVAICEIEMYRSA